MIDNKKDIVNENDIKFLVEAFYRKVLENNLISHFFKDPSNFSFETHLPIMIEFWKTLLLNTNSYHGNPMIKHVNLNSKTPIDKEHFSQWLILWEQTVSDLFEGEVANTAISKAKSIAQIMQIKLHSNNKLSI